MSKTIGPKEVDEPIQEFINEFNAEKTGEKSWVGEDNVVQISHKSVDEWNIEYRYEYGKATMSLVGNPGNYHYAFNCEGVTHYIERGYADKLCKSFGCMPTFEDAYIDADYIHYPVMFDLGEYVGIVAPKTFEENND